MTDGVDPGAWAAARWWALTPLVRLADCGDRICVDDAAVRACVSGRRAQVDWLAVAAGSLVVAAIDWVGFELMVVRFAAGGTAIGRPMAPVLRLRTPLERRGGGAPGGGLTGGSI